MGEFNKELLEKDEVILLTRSDLVKGEEIKKIKTKLKPLKRKIIVTSIHDEESIKKLMEILL